MKKLLTTILFFITQVLLCQNDIPDFEFGHDLENEFYYEFINDNVPFTDLTVTKYFGKRKEHHIKQITVTHRGRSLDSLYLQDSAVFNMMVRTGAYDHGYSYRQVYHYDDNGFIISKTRYPTTVYLTKRDTVLLNRKGTRSILKSDSLIVSGYYNDTAQSKAVYNNHLIYKIDKEAIMETYFDSTKNWYTSKVLGYNFYPTRYFYDSNNKIFRITCESKTDYYYDMTFNFPYKHKTVVNCTMRSFSSDSLNYMQNTIFKNKAGQIKRSMFYHKGKPEQFSCYLFIYDKQHNLTRIDRRNKAKGWFDDTERLYEFRHTYKGKKLSQTLVHYNFNMNYNDIIYFYNAQGLVSEIDIGNYKMYYQYNEEKN